jgi:hypothetical protein
VSRYLAGRPRKRSPTWRTFLENHLGQFTCTSDVLSPYASGDDVVDTFAGTFYSAASNQLSASSQYALVDWPAGGSYVLAYLALRIRFATAQACN